MFILLLILIQLFWKQHVLEKQNMENSLILNQLMDDMIVEQEVLVNKLTCKKWMMW